MLLIESITGAARQQQRLVLPDGSLLLVRLSYKPQQYGWFIDEITNKEFTLNGLRITNNLNMLRQWKNLIPFGLACYTDGNREPTQQEDFLSGASALYLLSADDVQAIEAYLAGG